MAKHRNGPRECFVARPGYAIVSVDYDACEMRTWSQVTKWILGYSDLMHILNDPARCPHVEMGAGILELPLAEAYALKGSARKDLRNLAKGPNFGLPGGMGWARLIDYCRGGYGVVLTPERAQKACAVWRTTYSEAQPYLDWVSSQIGRKRGSKGTIRQFWSGRVRGRVGFCDAANGYFQGLAADIALEAGSRMAEEAYTDPSSPLYGCRPLAFIHDEWLYEIPIDRIHEAGHRMAYIMTSTAMEICPDVLFTALPAAMLRWSKAFGDPVYTLGGKVVGPRDGGQLTVFEHAFPEAA